MIKSMVSRRVVSLLYVDQPRGVDVMQLHVDNGPQIKTCVTQLARELKFLKSELLQPSVIISRFLKPPAVFESQEETTTHSHGFLILPVLPRSVLVQHVSHLSAHDAMVHSNPNGAK